MADFVRSLPFLTETSDTFPVKFRVNRVNSVGAGGAAAEPANFGGWWKKPLVLEWNKKNSGYTGLFFSQISDFQSIMKRTL